MSNLVGMQHNQMIREQLRLGPSSLWDIWRSKQSMFSTRPESASHASCSHLLTRRYCILSSLDMPTKGTQVALDSDIEMFIIDNLEGDPRSLLACTLTCKIWHSYATVVLYETVFISSYSAFNALCAHRKQIKNDYVAKYTKCLEIHEGVKGTTPFAQEAIRRLGHLPFRALRRLVFSGVDFKGPSH